MADRSPGEELHAAFVEEFARDAGAGDLLDWSELPAEERARLETVALRFEELRRG